MNDPLRDLLEAMAMEWDKGGTECGGVAGAMAKKCADDLRQVLAASPSPSTEPKP